MLFVGGTRVGHAPKRLELPVGAHTLLLVRRDGQKLRRRIEVTARDTGLRPRRVRID